MQAVVMRGSRSKLAGAKCGLCPRPLLPGQTLLYKHMPNDSYDEDRLVFHLECMEALCERAPRGVPSTDPKAQAMLIRRQVDETGDIYGRRAS